MATTTRGAAGAPVAAQPRGFDAAGRMTALSIDTAGTGHVNVSRNYTTNGLNQYIAAGPASFTYDMNGNLTSDGTNTYLYDVAGRRTRLTYADGFCVAYDYDVVGNVTAIRENGATSGVGVLAAYLYDALGRRNSVTYGNGTVQTLTFDAASRLISLANNLTRVTTDPIAALTPLANWRQSADHACGR